MLRFAALYYEARASSDALGYVRDQHDAVDEKHGYEVLYPAYGTYVGGSLVPFGGAVMSLVGVIPGHIAGRIASSHVEENKSPVEENTAPASDIKEPNAAVMEQKSAD